MQPRGRSSFLSLGYKTLLNVAEDLTGKERVEAGRDINHDCRKQLEHAWLDGQT